MKQHNQSIILYAIKSKLPLLGYWPVSAGKRGKEIVELIWIRAEIVNAALDEALDLAAPRKGEIVLNSIPRL